MALRRSSSVMSCSLMVIAYSLPSMLVSVTLWLRSRAISSASSLMGHFFQSADGGDDLHGSIDAEIVCHGVARLAVGRRTISDQRAFLPHLIPDGGEERPVDDDGTFRFRVGIGASLASFVRR